eukprot:1004250-Amphidinium_carterae.1
MAFLNVSSLTCLGNDKLRAVVRFILLRSDKKHPCMHTQADEYLEPVRRNCPEKAKGKNAGLEKDGSYEPRFFEKTESTSRYGTQKIHS